MKPEGSDLFVGLMVSVLGLIGLTLGSGATDTGMYVFGLSLAAFSAIFVIGLIRRHYDRQELAQHAHAAAVARGAYPAIVYNEDVVRKFVTASMFWGVVAFLVGVVLAVEQVGLWAVGGLHRLWPLFVVALGVARLVAPARRGDGLLTFGAGLLFLAHTCHVARLHQTWPLFLVLVGISMLLRGRADACQAPRTDASRLG